MKHLRDWAERAAAWPDTADGQKSGGSTQNRTRQNTTRQNTRKQIRRGKNDRAKNTVSGLSERRETVNSQGLTCPANCARDRLDRSIRSHPQPRRAQAGKNPWADGYPGYCGVFSDTSTCSSAERFSPRPSCAIWSGESDPAMFTTTHSSPGLVETSVSPAIIESASRM